MTRSTLSRPAPAGSGATPVPLLEVRDLKVHFPLRGGRRGHVVRAVDGVSFDLAVGETLGLVGESGCGKTTVGRALLGLVSPTAGRVRYRGETLPPRRRAPALRRAMQIVFQDPTASLNPRMRVGQILAEPMLVHRIARGAELTALVDDLLVRCGLWTGAADRYPHAFSGGQ
ncbi:MAG: ATP-binding cassette domain-containing protein, partial [Phycisphaerales bacterium]|nr:ATP-binding cassette domain-containing protein [Phycisphaerales bacterium]